jgi:hypothetical protein
MTTFDLARSGDRRSASIACSTYWRIPSNGRATITRPTTSSGATRTTIKSGSRLPAFRLTR